jgi:hypothetical protein
MKAFRIKRIHLLLTGSSNDRTHLSPSSEEASAVSCPTLATLFAAVSGGEEQQQQERDGARRIVADPKPVDPSTSTYAGAGLLGPAPIGHHKLGQKSSGDASSSYFDDLFRGGYGSSDTSNVLSR